MDDDDIKKEIMNPPCNVTSILACVFKYNVMLTVFVGLKFDDLYILLNYYCNLFQQYLYSDNSARYNYSFSKEDKRAQYI
jgi:hypothetical protein